MPTFDLGKVTGERGESGVTPNIQVGKVTTLAAGSKATVTRQASSPDAAPVFDFGIPRGADATNTGDMVQKVYDPQGMERDIFAYADAKMAKKGGRFTGVVSGVSADVNEKSFRNIYFSKDAPPETLGEEGDIFIQLKTSAE